MRRLMIIALLGAMGCLAKAQDIPEKIYVNRYGSEKRVDVVSGDYLDSMALYTNIWEVLLEM